MKKWLVTAGLIAVIILSAIRTGIAVSARRARRPAIGTISRSKADAAGHTRGIVQVDLMRRIMADRVRAGVPGSAAYGAPGHRVPSQAHPLLGRAAPPIVLPAADGTTRDLRRRLADGPVVVVFYLGASCMACMTHLVELDVALPRFRERGATIWAISADTPETSRRRAARFGDLAIPSLSDPDHAVAAAYGAWKPNPGGEKDDGEALHGTFLVDRDGSMRWAYLGDRPFADVEALLAALADPERDPEGVAASSRVPR